MALHRQGSLDGLCGLYAVVNVVMRLYPELSPDDLIAPLVYVLEEREGMGWAYLAGLSRLDVSALLERATEICSLATGNPLSIQRPFWSRRPHCRRKFQSILANAIDHGSLTIIGFLHETGGHWAGVSRSGRRGLSLICSSGAKNPQMSNYLVKGSLRRTKELRIETGCTFLVARRAVGAGA